jgi:hypothetical protein
MRAVPKRLAEIVGAPVVVFGHTHEPWRQAAGDAVYVNSGTWLPATRPGLRRSFTHVLIQPRGAGMTPVVELRQWRDAGSLPFRTEEESGPVAIAASVPEVAAG